MGIDKTFNTNFSRRELKNTKYNCKVAMWQIPYDSRYLKYDTDKSIWFEADNTYHENEIETVEKELHKSLTAYKTYTKIMEYSDNSITEISTYPNGNQVKVNKNSDYVSVHIRNKDGKMAAEKFYNFSSNQGRKVIYKYYKNGDNELTVVRIFSYNSAKNRSADIVNYGYTSEDSKLTYNCELDREYYLLNGEEVDAKLNNKFEYYLKDKQGNELIFPTE